ncbi:MAG: AAA family ATPase [Aliarcobacter sp.]|nr:AAA family ATPase [Aliarcobacter sp.]
MELVYLWVDSYKNIKNQGFNFSPRFECEFDGENLTITEKEDYVSIFPDNINVTAIIGENGSGKSSILNAIINSSEDYFPKETNYILVFSNEKSEYYTSNFNIQTKISKCTNNDYKNSLVVYLDRGNNDKPIIIQNINKYNQEDSQQAFRNYQEIDVSKKRIVRLLTVEIGKIDSSFEISTFMYLANKITMKLKIKEELIGRYITFFAKDREKIEKLFLTIDDPIHQVLFLEGVTNNIKNINILKDKDKLKEQLIEKNIKYKTIDADISRVLHELTFNISELTDDEKDKYIRKHSYFYHLDFDLIDEKERHYNDLSHGEQMIFGQLLNLYFYTLGKGNNIFLFDEPEISLHPEWQRKYMNEILNLLKNTPKNNHFIFTSHSPFLLSDLPKENVIFLQKYKKDENKDQKEGNCKNITKDINIKTFGANIHTLLSNGFFMSDGLMGEFAKSKITEILDFLNDKEKLKTIQEDQLESIIKSIGEDFLRNKLLNLYRNKFIKDEKEKEKHILKNKIEELQKQYDELNK